MKILDIFLITMFWTVFLFPPACTYYEDSGQWVVQKQEEIPIINKVVAVQYTTGKYHHPYHVYLLVLDDGTDMSVDGKVWTNINIGDKVIKETFFQTRQIVSNDTKVEYRIK